VAVEHVSVPVRCHRCKQAFTTRPATDTALRTKEPKAAPGAAGLDVGSATSAGRVRKRNEDSCLVQRMTWSSLGKDHEIALLAVADGMGGHHGGELAGYLVIHTLGAAFAPLLSGALEGEYRDAAVPAEAVDAAVHEANAAIHDLARKTPGCEGMGAAAAFVLVWDGQAFVSHVGDCRVHHQRGGRLRQLTRDHTLVARMVELGRLSAREAANHPDRNQLTQAIGARDRVQPSGCRVRLRPGDWLLLASDGLTAHADERDLQEALRRPSGSAAELAAHLVDLANGRGGSDNCTVVAARLR
jgi:protein phosphatase